MHDTLVKWAAPVTIFETFEDCLHKMVFKKKQGAPSIAIELLISRKFSYHLQITGQWKHIFWDPFPTDIPFFQDSKNFSLVFTR